MGNGVATAKMLRVRLKEKGQKALDRCLNISLSPLSTHHLAAIILNSLTCDYDMPLWESGISPPAATSHRGSILFWHELVNEILRGVRRI